MTDNMVTPTQRADRLVALAHEVFVEPPLTPLEDRLIRSVVLGVKCVAMASNGLMANFTPSQSTSEPSALRRILVSGSGTRLSGIG